MKKKKPLPGAKRRGIYEKPNGPGQWNPFRSKKFNTPSDKKDARGRTYKGES